MKIKNLVVRFFDAMKVFPEDVKQFGVKVGCVIVWDKLFPPGKSKLYIKTIYKYVEKFCTPIIHKYNNKLNSEVSPKQNLNKIPVWVCWWQGEENMPLLVKACFKRLKNSIPCDIAEVHLITLDNYKTYVDLPENIMTLFSQGKIPYVALSDILRCNLLAVYGGMWIDSTVYLTDNMPPHCLTDRFFAQKMHDSSKSEKEACKGMWSGFLHSTMPNNIIPCFLRDAFELWWENHNKVIDYVIFDYFLMVAYNNIPEVKKDIDNVKPNNENIFGLNGMLNDEYTEEKFKALKKSNIFHKLSYKAEWKTETTEGNETFYGHLLKEYYNE